MEKEPAFKTDPGDAARVAARPRRAPRASGLASWFALLVLAALTAGSAFVAAGLPPKPPQSPSTPLLRQFCERFDCAFLHAGAVAREVRLAAPVMRAGAAAGTLAFSAEVAVADTRTGRPWPELVFEFFDAERRSLQVRRIAADDYAPRDGARMEAPFMVEMPFAGVPPAAAYYSITYAAPQ